MQQAFGAKVTTYKFETEISTYAVFLKNTAKREQKVLLFNKLNNLVSNNIWSNENIDFIILELTSKQKKFIENEAIISYIGEVHIDLEKLDSLMKGNFSLADM